VQICGRWSGLVREFGELTIQAGPFKLRETRSARHQLFTRVHIPPRADGRTMCGLDEHFDAAIARYLKPRESLRSVHAALISKRDAFALCRIDRARVAVELPRTKLGRLQLKATRGEVLGKHRLRSNERINFSTESGGHSRARSTLASTAAVRQSLAECLRPARLIRGLMGLRSGEKPELRGTRTVLEYDL
jgi:hypothetical protein